MSKHASFEDFIRIIIVVVGSNMIILAIVLFVERPFINERAFVLVTLIEVTGIILPRILRRSISLMTYRYRKLQNQKARTLIIGAGSAGEMAFKEMIKNPELNNIPVGFLDDNPEKLGKQIMGCSILGGLSELESIVLKYNVEVAIIAIKHLPK